MCVDCNTTCGLFSCGGYQANNVYYAVGKYVQILTKPGN